MSRLLRRRTFRRRLFAMTAAEISAAHGCLNILVNNADIVDLTDGIPCRGSLQAARRVFETGTHGDDAGHAAVAK